MEIAIQSSDELEQLRTRLRKMTDAQLVSFGKTARSLCQGRERVQSRVGRGACQAFSQEVPRPDQLHSTNCHISRPARNYKRRVLHQS